MKTNKPELHLVVLWHNALPIKRQVLDHIQSIEHLTILTCYTVTWSKKYLRNNFARFYGIKLPSVEGKIRECGRGVFYLIVLQDTRPKHGFCHTSRGHECANVTMFTLKQLFRSWSGGGHKVHTTNTEEETNHDLALLIGQNVSDYVQNCKETGVLYEGIPLKQDLVGAKNWQNLDELFYILNATTRYVVLRNFANLPNNFSTDLHGDIDILAQDFFEIFILSNAKKVFREPHRVHCSVRIGSGSVLFDFRFLGDGYYCLEWEKNMLSTRVLYNGFYVPNEEHHLFSLIYHVLVQKRRISPDYYEMIGDLFFKIYGEKPPVNNSFDIYANKLKGYMKEKWYVVTRPDDHSVVYNDYVVKMDNYKKRIVQDFGLKNVTHVYLDNGNGGGYSYFKGEITTNVPCFIKWGGLDDSVRREYAFSNVLSSHRKDNFCSPIYYVYNPPIKYVLFQSVRGETLETLKQTNKLKAFDYSVMYQDIKTISETLLTKRIMHRDIKPNNIIVTPSSRLVLIDYQFCMDVKEGVEMDAVLKNPEMVRELGDDFAEGLYSWDDQVSLKKLLHYIADGHKNTYREQQIYDQSYAFVTQNIGQYTYRFKKNFIFKRVPHWSCRKEP